MVVVALPPTSRRTAKGEPLDIQASDDFCLCFGRSKGDVRLGSAHLLDAERSGADLRTVAISVVEAVRRRAGDEDDWHPLLEDLVSMLPTWRLEGTHPREGLVWLGLQAMPCAHQEEDVLGWMDAFVSLDREGYTAEWLAKRLAAAHAVEWRSILTVADLLISERLRQAS